MLLRFIKLSVLVLLLLCGVEAAYSQADMLPDASTRSGRRSRADKPMGLDEMLAKQRAARDKKDHEQMLARGEQALKLATQLEASFAQNHDLSREDRARLESLEETVRKIREELGGDDDDSADVEPAGTVEESKPSTIEEAFKYLQSTTVKLVDELKKTTRFSISAIAIQSSNSVLKLVKFLRLRQ